MNIYNQEQDDAAPLGVFIEADSLEEADEKLQELGYEEELGYEDLPLFMTNDPQVSQ